MVSAETREVSEKLPSLGCILKGDRDTRGRERKDRGVGESKIGGLSNQKDGVATK